jgi:fructose-specific PTS system IIA-like component
MSLAISFACPLANGLHARPATSLATVCESFNADIQLLNTRNGEHAAARSVLALISADVRFEDHCELTVSGDDAQAAYDALQGFITGELPHCDDHIEPPAGVDGASRPVPRSLLVLEPELLQGVSLTSGSAFADAMVLSGNRIPKELVRQTGAGFDEEWQRIVTARSEVARELESTLVSKHGTEAGILRAHLAIIEDEEYSRQLRVSLQAETTPRSAAAAIDATVRYFDELLGNTGNPYLQERALDIEDISMQLLRGIYGDTAIAPPVAPDKPFILVAPSLTPGDFIALNNGNLHGLVLESGGQTSHTAILARAAGVPAVTGVTGAVAFIASCTGPVAVDADNGLLVKMDKPRIRDWYVSEQKRQAQIDSRYEGYRAGHARTADGRRIEVAANIALGLEAEKAFSSGAEGIGLFRTEMLFMRGGEAPAENIQIQEYQGVLEQAGDRPVIIRTFDIGGDKPVAWLKPYAEDNPFLGVRGVRLYRECEDVFRTQLRALIRAARFGNLRIMIPMITTVEEMQWVRDVYEQERRSLAESGTESGEALLGMMIEVPSAALAIDQFAEFCDFISIGSNDLAQYFLACDRGNPRLEALYSHYQPAFLRLLQRIVSDAHDEELWVGICGEMASDADALPLLAGLGLDEISVSAPRLAHSKARIAGLDSGSCKDLLERALYCASEQAVREEMRQFRLSLDSAPLFDTSLVDFCTDFESKEAAIKHLVDLAHLDDRTCDASALEEAVWQREDVFSTGLGFGIAIPHCKSQSVLHASLCIARLENALDWGSRDGQAVDTVMLLIVPDGDGAEVHLKIFAQLARNIMHEGFREELRHYHDAGSLVQFLEDTLGLASPDE